MIAMGSDAGSFFHLLGCASGSRSAPGRRHCFMTRTGLLRVCRRRGESHRGAAPRQTRGWMYNVAAMVPRDPPGGHPPAYPPGGQPPADIIPLSPFRAELGRGRRLRRADVLLAERDLESAVRALPADELYYVLHELGHEESGPLLAAATSEQLQVVLDFALWQRDRIVPGALAEWVEAMAHASPERIARWLAGLDAELVALVLRRGARIHDLTQGPPPEEAQGTFFPTPDGFFLLDVVGLPIEDGASAFDADEQDRTAVIIRLVDSLYRADKHLARRLLVAATGELDSELEEAAYRWQRGRMADLGFSDYYEALEVYRELDLAGVQISEGHA